MERELDALRDWALQLPDEGIQTESLWTTRYKAANGQSNSERQ